MMKSEALRLMRNVVKPKDDAERSAVLNACHKLITLPGQTLGEQLAALARIYEVNHGRQPYTQFTEKDIGDYLNNYMAMNRGNEWDETEELTNLLSAAENYVTGTEVDHQSTGDVTIGNDLLSAVNHLRNLLEMALGIDSPHDA